eukprot:CAMPEP_0178463518 /NCGR_PEP_ID=MMETSP0689_2-20121128/50375_1 /TAXON_ID=160604 /ORGANISM="Amphidinium massartii, Strain CS-259" /LENGTH=684 /DNA_ID=CAMNT_0020090405 /DNA_START=231 /DNA_END=2282 /DNA_ORIENTATION=+
MGQPLLVNLTSEMGAEWFPPHERPLAAMVSNLMNFIGSSLSFMLPPLIVSSEEGQTQESVQQEVTFLLWVHFIIACIAFFLTLLLYRPAPAADAHTLVRIKRSFASEVVLILTCPDFWIVNTQFAIFVAIGHAFDAVEGSLLKDNGYSPSLIHGQPHRVPSAMSTLLESRLIHSAALYTSALKVTHCFMVGSLLFGFLALWNRWHEACFVIAIGIMGLATPGWGCSCELGSEVCYPASEATVVSLLEVCSNLLGVGSIMLTQHLIDTGYGARVLVLMAVLAACAGGSVRFLSGRLRRTEAEEANGVLMEAPLLSPASHSDANKELGLEDPKVLPLMELADMEDVMCAQSTMTSMTSVSCTARFSRRASHGLNFLPQPRHWAVMAAVPIFVVVTAILVSHEAHVEEAATADVIPPIDPDLGCGQRDCLEGNFSQSTYANGMREPLNFVIKCLNYGHHERMKLDRFRRYAGRANLTFEEVACEKGSKANVEAAVDEGLLPESAIEAVGGKDRQGRKRSQRLAVALTHLRLIKKAFASKTPFNIFDTKELVYRDYRLARSQIVGRLDGRMLDFVKLNIQSGESGQILQFKDVGEQSWMYEKVHVLPLSAYTNTGMGNYLVTQKGAAKMLQAGRSYDTHGKWQSFGEHILDELVNMGFFLGYSVAPDLLSLYCADKPGPGSAAACELS